MKAGVLVALIVALATSAGAQGLSPDNAEALVPYETALAAAPDDLRAGNEYRMAAIEAKAFDRAIAFFERLVADHPDAGNAHLNLGFAYVDKIPVAGSITQVILANNALKAFSRALDIRTTWLGLYTRGNSYLFWPRIFKRTQPGVDDLEAALKMQKADPERHRYYSRVYVSLGDGYWKLGDTARARTVWTEGEAEFPDEPGLRARLAAPDEGLAALIDPAYDPSLRVDTNLREMWTD